MTDPVLHVLAGPNGAGKSTFYARILGPVTGLDFINADLIAADRWPEATAEHSYEAAAAAATEREHRIAARRSFATETVFSHPSKIQLLRDAQHAGYRVSFHVILIPEELAVARVVNRVDNGGHFVPEHKVRARFDRLWEHVREGIAVADDAFVYDNTRAVAPFRLVATYLDGHLTDGPDWPPWTPSALRDAGH